MKNFFWRKSVWRMVFNWQNFLKLQSLPWKWICSKIVFERIVFCDCKLYVCCIDIIAGCNINYNFFHRFWINRMNSYFSFYTIILQSYNNLHFMKLTPFKQLTKTFCLKGLYFLLLVFFLNKAQVSLTRNKGTFCYIYIFCIWNSIDRIIDHVKLLCFIIKVYDIWKILCIIFLSKNTHLIVSIIFVNCTCAVLILLLVVT